MDKYAIGHADNFDVILSGGVERVEYDLKQVQDEGRARYHFLEEMHETDDIGLGEMIPLTIAEDLQTPYIDVYGFCVPDHMLASFISEYPEKTILRQS